MKNVISQEIIDAALAFVSQGFKVFPTRPDKTPYTTHGLKDATQLQATVKEYWARFTDAGIGLVTDGLCVLDFDLGHGGLVSKRQMETKYGRLPQTRTHRTGGGGEHWLYRAPGVRNTTTLAGYSGVDVRGAGGYIVVPPSLHPNGKRYEVLDPSEIASAPNWLLELCKQKQPAAIDPGRNGHRGTIPAGERNATLTRIAGGLRRPGVSSEAIFAALMVENTARCQPPLPEAEVKRIAESIARYAPAQSVTSEQTKAPPPEKTNSRFDEFYRIENGCLCYLSYNKFTNEETPVALCNFVAKIDADVLKDDGQTKARYLNVSGKAARGEQLAPCEVTAESFRGMGWVMKEWGTRAEITPAQNTERRLSHAIQLLSPDVEQRLVYTHTGWRDHKGGHQFLSSAGGLDDPSVFVELDPHLSRYDIPRPEIAAQEAIAGSLRFLDVAAREVTLPLLAAMYLTPLSPFLDPDFTIWLNGRSGSFKSVLTALALCHYGRFDFKSLPAAWSDTQNMLERLLFLAKDVPLVIDDWAPASDPATARELETKAGSITRNQGNRHGRGRMKPDTSTRQSYPSRALLISSGEQLPSGESRNSRILTLEIERNQVDIGLLTTAQHDANLYRAAMYYYLTWIRGHWDLLAKDLVPSWEALRQEAWSNHAHPRMADIVACLMAGLRVTLSFATDHEALTVAEAQEIDQQGWQVFTDVSREQGARVEEESNATRCIEGLRSLLGCGRAILRKREEESTRAPGPNQSFIGWYGPDDEIWLDPDEAHKAVFAHYTQGGGYFVKAKAVWRDLLTAGLVKRHDNGRATVSEYIPGLGSKRVIVLSKDTLYPGGNAI